MNRVSTWKTLESIDQLENVIQDSKDKPVAIFKHSTRCSISAMALNRLERDWNHMEMNDIDFYYLDLIAHRDISNEIASSFEVMHQSPQLILIKDGKAVYHNSHMGISYNELKSKIS